jgi:hypothetical protein
MNSLVSITVEQRNKVMNVLVPSNPLVLDLVEWVAKAPRPYADVMDAWRTSCPRLTIWEDAVDGGYVVRERAHSEGGVVVKVTDRGRVLLAANGRGTAPPS